MCVYTQNRWGDGGMKWVKKQIRTVGASKGG